MIKLTRKIESLLEKLGAKGRGLHQRILSIESKLRFNQVKVLRWIATMRNKIVHEDGFKIDDMEGFVPIAKYLISKPLLYYKIYNQ